MAKNLSLLPGARLLVQLYTQQLSGIVKAINNQNNAVVASKRQTLKVPVKFCNQV